MYDFWEEQERAEQEYDRQQNEKTEAYEDGYWQGIADGVDKFFREIVRNNIITNDNNLIIASMIGEKIKEGKNG